MAEVAHPNVVKIYELAEDENHYFIISELVEHGELENFANDRKNSDEGPLKEYDI